MMDTGQKLRDQGAFGCPSKCTRFLDQRTAAFMMHTQAAFDRVERSMALAEEAFKRVVEESDSEDDDSSSTRSGRSLPPPVVGEDDLRPLESVAKKARSAGRAATKVCAVHGDD